MLGHIQVSSTPQGGVGDLPRDDLVILTQKCALVANEGLVDESFST